MTQSGGKWGFQSEKSNLVNLDENDRKLYRDLVKKVPSLSSCIFCGSCSATCTSESEGMNFRMIHLLFQRGEMLQIRDKIRSCLLCGKCILVCPRNVDTRSAIYNLKIMLHELQ